MATYKDIHGTAVQNIAGDPDNTTAGQFWYDSSISEFKYQDQFVGNAWSTSGALNNARNALAGGGTQTATIAFGGYDGNVRAYTESYNGSSWTEVNDLNH